jgi:hypothetical protein
VKTCSKCGRELPRECFVKSPRYSDGLYPLCKECRKAGRLRYLEQHPLCSKCGIRAHRKGCAWCSECRHEDEFKHRPPKFIPSKKTKSHICPRCGIRSKLAYHGWCRECKNNSTLALLARRRGLPVPPPVLAKKTNRHYINSLISRGKVKRQPCKYCGSMPTEFHHLSYGQMSTHGEFVCKLHHWMAHHIERKLLTVYASLA